MNIDDHPPVQAIYPSFDHGTFGGRGNTYPTANSVPYTATRLNDMKYITH
jgi:hypothetical protein